VLDFGTGGSHLALHAALCGYEVLSIDLLPVEKWYTHPRIRFRQMDVLTAGLPEAFFDLVIN
jgi:2-polyprenyl-3-methyl-5-hydroxy-6-metoxy-1,4-benzoquinol methylase